ncbi:serine/threonine-protein kinase [Streptomyces sp. NK08204]|uniref:serine/threonine-protein kinase n=1 Tax=Streptomyces sp. NK08204 TaxID=2873260 RepID=UPI001CECD09B
MPEGAFQSLGEDDPRVIGGYRIAARLGAGGMGKVYLSHTPGGRPVAIKVIRPEFAEDPEFRRRFAQEVRAAERVQGLYTAPVIDSDTEGPRPWLATAYVSGPSLAAAVAEHGPLPTSTVLLLAAGVAEALQVVHGAGIVHRDLKPSNVLLAADGPRVIDFGIARAADTTALTGSGVTVGTPAFMSPEQAAGRAVGPKSDVFALGQVAAFAALGRSAHGDGPSHAVLYRIVHEEADLTGLPAELTELVRRCLAKDPDARPELSEVLALCSAASGDTQLRRPEDWLPGAVTTAIADRYRAPMPGQAPGPVPPQHPPTAVADAAPQQPAAPPQPGYAPTQMAQSVQWAQSAYAPTQMAQPVHSAQSAYAPTQMAQPLQTAQPFPSATPYPGPPPVVVGQPGRPGRRRRTGLVLGCVTGALLLGLGVIGYVTDNSVDSSGTTSTGTAKPSGGKNGGARPSGGTTASRQPGASASSSPTPTVYKNFNLTDGYHVQFGDQPLTPHRDSNDDLYLICPDVTSCDFGSYNDKLVLLDQGETGSLDTCKQDTRYLPQEVSLNRFSRGRQLCVTTDDGTVALVTFQGQSPSTSASRYVTLDISIWRDAIPATQD